MKKPLLIKPLNDPASAKNVDTLMSNFTAATFIPDHLSARFSNPSVAAQRGFFQKLNSTVYVCIELCPDINNPLGGGATVSFTSGDVITAPFSSINPQTYVAGDWLGLNTFTLTDLSNGTQYTNCRVQTNTGTGLPEIRIGHNIAATASTFMLEGFYITRT